MGRKKKLTAAKLERELQDYIRMTELHNSTPSVAGVCRYLHITKQTLYNYRDEPDYSVSVNDFLLYLEDFWVNEAREGGKHAAFVLERNMGYGGWVKEERQTIKNVGLSLEEFLQQEGKQSF